MTAKSLVGKAIRYRSRATSPWHIATVLEVTLEKVMLLDFEGEYVKQRDDIEWMIWNGNLEVV